MKRPPNTLDPADYTRGVKEHLTSEHAMWIMTRTDEIVRAIRERGIAVRLPEPDAHELIRAALVEAYRLGRKPMRRNPRGGPR